MTTTPADSPIPYAVQNLCVLFSNELAEVKFPDVDAGVLRAAIEQVVSHAEAVARAEAVLANARENLQESQEALLQKAQRALAYAKVFAEENEALSAKLSEVSLPRSPRRVARSVSETPVAAASASGEEVPAQAPKRRGRPPKDRGAELFEQPNEASAA